MRFATLQPETGERGIDFAPFCLIEREIRFETKGRVFCCIQMGEEIVLLKQDTHGAFGGCEPCHIISVDPDPARLWIGEACNNIQKRGLSAARRTNNPDYAGTGKGERKTDVEVFSGPLHILKINHAHAPFGQRRRMPAS